MYIRKSYTCNHGFRRNWCGYDRHASHCMWKKSVVWLRCWNRIGSHIHFPWGSLPTILAHRVKLVNKLKIIEVVCSDLKHSFGRPFPKHEQNLKSQVHALRLMFRWSTDIALVDSKLFSCVGEGRGGGGRQPSLTGPSRLSWPPWSTPRTAFSAPKFLKSTLMRLKRFRAVRQRWSRFASQVRQCFTQWMCPSTVVDSYYWATCTRFSLSMRTRPIFTSSVNSEQRVSVTCKRSLPSKCLSLVDCFSAFVFWVRLLLQESLRLLFIHKIYSLVFVDLLRYLCVTWTIGVVFFFRK